MRSRVILAEDDDAVGSRLCALLSSEFEVVAAVSDGAAALEKATELRPDFVLLDIVMPGMDGFAAARALRLSMPSVPVIFVTRRCDRAYVEEAFAAGGSGYVLKGSAAVELSAALREVWSGRRYLSARLRVA